MNWRAMAEFVLVFTGITLLMTLAVMPVSALMWLIVYLMLRG